MFLFLGPLGPSTWLFLAFLLASLIILLSEDGEKRPGPKKWPIIGSLLYFAKFPNPIEAYSALRKKFGDVVYIKLGTLNAVVVSGSEKIRQVLVQKSNDFDSRPGFSRYNIMFHNNRENSVAFADWSKTQKLKRSIISHYAFPNALSFCFEKFDPIVGQFTQQLSDRLKMENLSKPIFLKPYFRETAGLIFLKYFCNVDVGVGMEEDFLELVKHFDSIFQEINRGDIGDLFPALMPFISTSHLVHMSTRIRYFVMKYIYGPQQLKMKAKEVKKISSGTNGEKTLMRRPSKSLPDLQGLDENNNGVTKKDGDCLLEGLLRSIKGDFTLNEALFALEDIIGGHSATGNFLSKAFIFLGQNPEVQDRIVEEVESTGDSEMLSLRNKLPYTEAVVLESMRHISSQIVPHVANKDTTIDDFPIKKGEAIFFNNYDINFSSELWKDPQAFDPSRFITEEGSLLKPDFFVPFGAGKRSCLGYRINNWVSHIMIATLCRDFVISLDPTETYETPIDIAAKGTLAIAGEGKRFILTPR